MNKIMGTKEANDIPPFEFHSECTPISITDDYISVLLTLYTYIGGAHGITELVCFNYDTATNQYVERPQVRGMSLKEIADIVRPLLEKKLSINDPNFDKDWLISGTEPTLQNYSVFTIDTEKTIIWFQDYQVAPHSDGILSVSIPHENQPLEKIPVNN